MGGEKVGKDKIRSLREEGLPWTRIANELNVSRSTLGRWRLSVDWQDPLRAVDDFITRDAIREFMFDNRRAGEQVVIGMLRTQGIYVERRRFRRLVEEVDVGGRDRRAPRRGHLPRGVYNSRGPGFTWHADTYHKLGRYGFVLFGCIDGFSRQVVCLKVGPDNRASTHLSSFSAAVVSTGVPRRLRLDAGMENVAIARVMVRLRGVESILIGKSVHNQRIERFWRDIYTNVAETYYLFFHDLEESNPGITMPVNVWVLQWLFMPLLQAKMDQFRGAWNMHSMRTAHHLTPNAQVLLATDNFYIPYDQDEFDTVAVGLEEEYEGRLAARSQNPFATVVYEEAFKAACPPLNLQHTKDDYLQIIHDTFVQVNALLVEEETFLNNH